MSDEPSCTLAVEKGFKGRQPIAKLFLPASFIILPCQHVFYGCSFLKYCLVEQALLLRFKEENHKGLLKKKHKETDISSPLMGILWWKNYVILHKQNLLKIVKSFVSQVLRFDNLHFVLIKRYDILKHWRIMVSKKASLHLEHCSIIWKGKKNSSSPLEPSSFLLFHAFEIYCSFSRTQKRPSYLHENLRT